MSEFKVKRTDKNVEVTCITTKVLTETEVGIRVIELERAIQHYDQQIARMEGYKQVAIQELNEIKKTIQ